MGDGFRVKVKRGELTVEEAKSHLDQLGVPPTAPVRGWLSRRISQGLLPTGVAVSRANAGKRKIQQPEK